MPKKNLTTEENGSFGRRLARLRKAAGYSQRELAEELGITRRVIVYYERETTHPPTSLIVPLTKALGISSDELLGIKHITRKSPARDARLWRRFNQIEKIPPKERRHLLHVIDNFLNGIKTGKQS